MAQERTRKKTVAKGKSDSDRALRERIKKLERERDYYLKAVHLLMPSKARRLTKREMLELRENSVPFEDVIAEVEKIVKAGHVNARS